MDISIVIVNYNTSKKTINCINSIKESDTADLNWEVIVVDNNSKNNDVEQIKSAHSDVKVVENKQNVGMGAGNNVGISQAGGDFILILNPDTLIKQDAIKVMYEYIKDKKEVGIVAPKLLNPDASLQYSCLRFPRIYTPVLRRTFLGRLAKKYLNDFLMKNFDHNKTREVDWIIGSCLLLDRKLLDKTGKIFDEKYFMYFEDTDLCRRAWGQGLKVVYHPQAKIIHDHMRESAGKPWYISPFLDKLTREHIKSWIKYFINNKKHIK